MNFYFPFFGLTSPVIKLKIVILTPFGPNMPNICPSFILKLILSKTIFPIWQWNILKFDYWVDAFKWFNPKFFNCAIIIFAINIYFIWNVVSINFSIFGFYINFNYVLLKHFQDFYRLLFRNNHRVSIQWKIRIFTCNFII